jgi:sec-independent protein translocase protein TatA
MSLGIFQILFVALLVLVLFGRGRISDVLGDVGRGIKSFRAGLGESEGHLPAPVIEAESVADKTSR